MRTYGHIQWWNADKGYGFVSADDNSGEQIFLHASSFRDREAVPCKDMAVSYDVGSGRKGPQAVDVRIEDSLVEVRPERAEPARASTGAYFGEYAADIIDKHLAAVKVTILEELEKVCAQQGVHW